MPLTQSWCVSEPGTPGQPNEDFAATVLPASGTGGAVLALDGVTPPADGDNGCVHGVPWFAGRLGGALAELAGGHRELALTSCLAQAIARTAEAHRDTCDLYHPATPQATVVVARWDERTVEYLVLSDSALLLEHRDGTVEAVLDTRLDDLRPAARQLPPGAARVAFFASLRNAEEGFFTAAADPSVAGQAITGSVPRDRLRALVALTDGLGRWVDVFRLGGWPELFAVLAKEGPQSAIDQVREAEHADPAGTVFPRGKPQDDATAVFVRL